MNIVIRIAQQYYIYTILEEQNKIKRVTGIYRVLISP